MEDKQTQDRLREFDIRTMINDLKLYSEDVKALTEIYTKIFMDENVVNIVTRISQNPIFMEHFPELYAKNPNGESVINCQQNTPYHRYGVFKHTLFAMECVGNGQMKLGDNDLKLLKWTMFLHDIAKPVVKTSTKTGKDSFEGHEEAALPIARAVLDRFDFTEDEKNIIITLIKYHDQFLNEGELTWDNLSFLARELGNKKELFDFLIEVKLADNKAKTIDVYDKFLLLMEKYRNFEKEYFNLPEAQEENNIELQDDEVIVNGQNSYLGKELVTDQDNEEALSRYLKKQDNTNIKISNEKFEQIYNNIVESTNVTFFYQPVLKLKTKAIFGYQVYIDVIDNDDIPLEIVLNKSQELYKFDKLNNRIMLRYFDKIQELQNKFENSLCFMFQNNLKSYMVYNNKDRISDIVKKCKSGMIFNDYMFHKFEEINIATEKLLKNDAFIVLDNIDIFNLTQSDIETSSASALRYKLEDEITEKHALKLTELAILCENCDKTLWVSGIDSKEQYDKIKSCGVHLIQGEYIGPILAFPNHIVTSEL